jgi:hypothetical protein
MGTPQSSMPLPGQKNPSGRPLPPKLPPCSACSIAFLPFCLCATRCCPAGPSPGSYPPSCPCAIACNLPHMAAELVLPELYAQLSCILSQVTTPRLSPSPHMHSSRCCTTSLWQPATPDERMTPAAHLHSRKCHKNGSQCDSTKLRFTCCTGSVKVKNCVSSFSFQPAQ